MGDDERFGEEALPTLRRAVGDLSCLLGRGYPEGATLKLVGDRYAIDRRQRAAVRRASCSESDLAIRTSRRAAPDELRSAELWIDTYNVLVTVRTALEGGIVIAARDGSYRDLAGLTRELVDAPLADVGRCLEELAPGRAVWCLDRPVSGSGRLRAAIEGIGAERGWPWEALVVGDPDPVLAGAPSGTIVATADSAILDRCGRWFPLARWVVEQGVPGARVIDLARPALQPDSRRD